MTHAMAEQNFQARAELFKALGHPVRLLILSLVRLGPRHGQELAAILGLNPATVSHHLSKLAEVGLLKSQPDQYYQVYSLDGDVWERRLDELAFVSQPGLASNVTEDAYRDRVIQTFFRHGRLVQVPAQLKKQIIVLQKIAQEFEPGRSYDEHEVNQILVEFNEDVAALRRGLISHHLLAREQGVYRRLENDVE